jgi:hypothetical protein
MITLALDPGLQHFGAALMDGKTLVHAALIRAPQKSEHTMESARELACMVCLWIYSTECSPGLVVCEVPKIYPARFQRGNQNDLVTLAGFAYAVTGMISEKFQCRIDQVFPRDWKGTIDADVCTARIEARLSDEEKKKIEKCPKSLRHNVIDAIGIALHSCGRFDPIRVYPGAT